MLKKAPFIILYTLLLMVVKLDAKEKSAKELNDFCGKHYQTKPDKTLPVAKKALSLAMAENNTLETIRAYENIGLSYDFLGHFDTALVYFDKCMALFKSNDQSKEYLNVLKS